MLNLYHIEECSHIYGTGKRTVLWFQGCKLHCTGCWNTQMFSFNPKELYIPSSLLKKILKYKDNIEGISLLGGEPLDQNIDELKEFLRLVVEHNLSVMLFTGYEALEIKKYSDLLDYVDVLVSGRYKENLRTTEHYLIGSTNQKIEFLSSRYSESDMLKNANYQEIIIDSDGTERLLGFPN